MPHQTDSRTRPSGQPAWGRAILEAIRGTQQDFTSGSLVRAVALLAHPLGLGAEGIFVSVAATQVVYAAVGIAWFQRGHWKSKVV